MDEKVWRSGEATGRSHRKGSVEINSCFGFFGAAATPSLKNTAPVPACLDSEDRGVESEERRQGLPWSVVVPLSPNCTARTNGRMLSELTVCFGETQMHRICMDPLNSDSVMNHKKLNAPKEMPSIKNRRCCDQSLPPPQTTSSDLTLNLKINRRNNVPDSQKGAAKVQDTRG